MATIKAKSAPVKQGNIEVEFITKDMALETPYSLTAYFIKDLSCPGLLLRIGGKKKTWIVRRKLFGTTSKLSIGECPPMTPDAARKQAQRALLNMADGIHPKADIRTRKAAAEAEREAKEWNLDRLWDDYLAETRDESKKLSDRTVKDMNAAKEKLRPSGLLKRPASLITAQDIRAAYDDMLARTNSKRADAGGATSAAQAMRYARAVLRYGLKEKIDGNLPDPFDAIPERQKWRQPKAKDRTVIEGEGDLARWWKAIEGLRDKTDGRARAQDMIADWLVLTVLWGTRSRSELLPLEWKHINFKNRIATIPKTKTTAREIPFGPYAEKILRKRFEDEDRDPQWLFPATRAGRTEKTYLKEPKATLVKVIKESGVDFSTHDLRRTFSSILGETGASVYQTKAAMHHSAGRDVTEKHYMRIRIKALRQVFENLEQAILEEAGVGGNESPKASN